MGMYDHVHYKGKLYQTKDFDCQMDDYYITDDGHLELKLHIVEGTPKSEMPYPNAEPGSIESVIGIWRTVPTERNRIDFHGVFEMVDRDGEFVCKFTDGLLVSVTEKSEE